MNSFLFSSPLLELLSSLFFPLVCSPAEHTLLCFERSRCPCRGRGGVSLLSMPADAVDGEAAALLLLLHLPLNDEKRHRSLPPTGKKVLASPSLSPWKPARALARAGDAGACPIGKKSFFILVSIYFIFHYSYLDVCTFCCLERRRGARGRCYNDAVNFFSLLSFHFWNPPYSKTLQHHHPPPPCFCNKAQVISASVLIVGWWWWASVWGGWW